MITKFKIFEIKREKVDSAKFYREKSENLEDTILFINEDRLITNEWKESITNALTTLPNEYKEKVYSSRLIYNVDVPKELNGVAISKGDKVLSNVGISDVGKYWDSSDLPFLNKHFEKYNLKLDYVHEYHYVSIHTGEGLAKYYYKIANKYNM